MACLEHKCHTCGNEWFDNLPSKRCPICFSPDTTMYFDEDHEPEEVDERD